MNQGGSVGTANDYGKHAKNTVVAEVLVNGRVDFSNNRVPEYFGEEKAEHAIDCSNNTEKEEISVTLVSFVESCYRSLNDAATWAKWVNP